MTKVVKRNGQEVGFNKTKIKQAISKAMRNGSGIVKPDIARMVASDTEAVFASVEKVGIGQIEQYVVERLIHYGQTETALAYEKFKVLASLRRETKNTDEGIIGIVKGSNQEAIRENANKRGEQLSASRDLIADDVQKDIMLRKVLPVRVAENHLEGRLYIHDLGYNLGHSFNCCLTDLKTILEGGTVINDILIDPQKKFLTAMTVASQVAAQMTSSQWGGNTFSIAHLAPIARKAKEWHYKEKVAEYDRLGVQVSDEKIKDEAQRSWQKELTDGVQTFQYQLQTFATASGMSPFLTLGMNINEDPKHTVEIAEISAEIFKQRIKGVKNEAGVYVGVAFPKLVYVLDENNTYKDSEYRWLTELAAECNIKRMVPDYISAKVMKEQTGHVYFPMGCRSFLNTWVNPETGQAQWYGRFNAGVATLNLPDIVLAAKGNKEEFYNILDKRLEVVDEWIAWRKEYMKNTSSSVSPLHYNFGAISRLPKGSDTNSLWTKRTSISLGYCGLYEVCQGILGESNSTPKGKELSLEILRYLKDWTEAKKEEHDLGVGLYGTPGESNLGTLLEKSKSRYGVVKGITDKPYFTNSFHITPSEEISAFDKLEYEAPFHEISSGGCISYVESASLNGKEEMMLQLIEKIYETVRYAEVNLKIDYCYDCGSHDKIFVNDEMEFECSVCGNEDFERMSVLRRTCGYLSSTKMRGSRMADIKDRVEHM